MDAPLRPAGRIASLDILRGVALLGMFVVHFHERSTEPGGVDDLVRTLVWRLVESKSHGTFALLFGAGFAIQLRRAERQEQPFVGRCVRRLVVLSCFGFAAHAFWGFNVLLGYAVWGAPLLLIRKWSTPALLLTAVLSAASVGLYHLGASLYLAANGGQDAVAAHYQWRQAVAADVNGAVRAAEAQDTYSVLVAARLRHMRWFHTQPFFFMPGATLSLFIVGLLLVRHRVFQAPLEHTRLLAGVGVFGVVSWLAANWLVERWGLGPLMLIFRDQWLTFAYVAAALLLLAHRPALIGRLQVIGNAGRMALTNYLLQIAVLDLLFSGYGVGLGQVRPVVGLTFALGCFAVECALSTAWLARFRLGPAEWLWRSFTYGRLQPWREVHTQSLSAEA